MRRTLACCSILLACSAALPAFAAPQKLKIAVMPLECRDGVNPTLAEVLTDLLAAELTSRPALSVITPKDVEAALGFEKQKAKLNATVAASTGGDVCSDNSCLQEIGGALGVDLMISGTVSRLGSSWILTVQSFNPRKAEVVKRHYSRVTSEQQDALLDEMPKIAAELFPDAAAGSHVSAPPVRTAPPVAAAPGPAAANAPAPAAPGTGLLRVAVTCGDDGKLVLSKGDLIVERLVDDSATALNPKNSLDATYRIDPVTKARERIEPRFAEYEVPAGEHRFRVRTRKCAPHEQSVTIDHTSPFELNTRLAIQTARVKFRPAVAGAPGRFILRDAARKELCVLPCEWSVAADSVFTVWYENDGDEAQAGVPSVSLLSGAPSGVATVSAVHERSALGPGLMLGSLLYMGIGAGYYFVFSNLVPGDPTAELFTTVVAGAYFGFGAVAAITGAALFFSGALDKDVVDIRMAKETGVTTAPEEPALRWAVGPTGLVVNF